MRILFLRNPVLLDAQVLGKVPVPGRGGWGCPLVEEGAALGQKGEREKGGKLPGVRPLPVQAAGSSPGRFRAVAGPSSSNRNVRLEEVRGTGADLEPELSSGGQVWLRLHTGLCEDLTVNA